ncbi:SDR family NAD(P)-dependent oxidoreductase [Phenylobacterium sp.]|uniref:SDR family NAD(P)-dependent oxidoreductase n=1 Tax=Phenylobacterium sp. TaxID=1871053 RepID=UPI0025CF15F1|nr:SDR family oxidoreductase [Phenylobacterium sp.]MBX3484859.1 SDR family oxidoreductase [Phenylobacterium sp.]MCW5760152.1 SDR family oxidoreductase [Phenylobacterium sp.]
MAGRLAGKVAIITGTGSGMGRSAALMFAREGAKVVGCDINPAAGGTADDVRATGGEMVSLQPVDLSGAEGAERLVAFALEHYGRIDVVYNNAAMAYFAFVAEMDYATFNRTQIEEVDIIFHLCRAAWPHLVAAGGGSIINTASTAAKKGSRGQGMLAHSAAKGAVTAMTRQYACEGGQYGIRANTISPGMIRSAQTEPLMKQQGWTERAVSRQLLQRIGEPEEVAATALFLASDESSFITGTDIAVDGGTMAN